MIYIVLLIALITSFINLNKKIILMIIALAVVLLFPISFGYIYNIFIFNISIGVLLIASVVLFIIKSIPFHKYRKQFVIVYLSILILIRYFNLLDFEIEKFSNKKIIIYETWNGIFLNKNSFNTDRFRIYKSEKINFLFNKIEQKNQFILRNKEEYFIINSELKYQKKIIAFRKDLVKTYW